MWLAAGRPHRARGLYAEALHEATARDGASGADVAADALTCTWGSASWTASWETSQTRPDHLETAEALGERCGDDGNRHRWFVAMARVRRRRG